MLEPKPEILPGAAAIVQNAAVVRPGERVCVIVDPRSEPIGRQFERAAKQAGARVAVVVFPLARGHGETPPEDLARQVIGHDVVLASTTFSLSHTQMRLEACRRGGRFLSLADYDEGMLRGGGTLADFAAAAPVTRRIADAFIQGSRARLTTKAGTDLSFNIAGRGAMACPAYCPSPGDFGSPPDIEANVAPVEGDTHGVLVVDGSIPMPGLGLIHAPVIVDVEGGRAVRAHGGPQADLLLRTWERYPHAGTRVAAELGVGLNPEARLCGRMLEDEGVLGTAHVGFGSNVTIGGTNPAPVHIDLICRHATVTVDGAEILRDGNLPGDMVGVLKGVNSVSSAARR